MGRGRSLKLSLLKRWQSKRPKRSSFQPLSESTESMSSSTARPQSLLPLSSVLHLSLPLLLPLLLISYRTASRPSRSTIQLPSSLTRSSTMRTRKRLTMRLSLSPQRLFLLPLFPLSQQEEDLFPLIKCLPFLHVSIFKASDAPPLSPPLPSDLPIPPLLLPLQTRQIHLLRVLLIP